MSILNNTPEMLAAAHETAKTQAAEAATEFCNRHFGGRDGGACGFAWVTFYPEHKGNTRLGKQERRMIESLGFSKTYTGSYQLWDPAKFPGQSVDCKYAGAQAYAKSFAAETNAKVYAGERLD